MEDPLIKSLRKVFLELRSVIVNAILFLPEILVSRHASVVSCPRDLVLARCGSNDFDRLLFSVLWRELEVFRDQYFTGSSVLEADHHKEIPKESNYCFNVFAFPARLT